MFDGVDAMAGVDERMPSMRLSRLREDDLTVTRRATIPEVVSDAFLSCPNRATGRIRPESVFGGKREVPSL